MKRGAEQRVETRAEAAGRAASRHGAHVNAAGLFDRLGEAFEAGGEMLDALARCALLRTVNARDPAGAAKKIMDVAGDVDANAGETRIKVRAVYGRKIEKSDAARADFIAHAVEHAYAEGLRHAGPAIVRSGIPAADEDAPCARVERSQDEFAYAVCRRASRIAMIMRNEREPGCGRHLDDRRSLGRAAEDSPGRVNGSADRPSDLGCLDQSAGEPYQGAYESFGAVINCKLDDV